MLDYKIVTQLLINWFNINKRDLPWRKNRSWYSVWISEIMLQQTQVEQVLEYYVNFMKKFSTLDELASSDLADILKLWEGLGYYSRARNLHKTAKIVEENLNGIFPIKKTEMLKLPGIGEYTANAILSIVYNKPYSVVDGNVKRVMARLFSIKNDINSSDTLSLIQSETDKLLPQDNAGTFNEAIMELGALICLPKNPTCLKCPLKSQCSAYKNNLVHSIPFKTKKGKKPTVHVVAQIVKKDNKYLIVKRKDAGLLGGYWEFPIKEINSIKELNNQNNINSIPIIKHTYTHFNLSIYPKKTTFDRLVINKDLYVEKKMVFYKNITQYPIHRAMNKVLEYIEDS